MRKARQVFDIETAENALIFFKNGVPAYRYILFTGFLQTRPEVPTIHVSS